MHLLERSLGLTLLLTCGLLQAAPFDLILQGGLIYDGSGKPPYRADIAVQDNKIAAIGDLTAAQDQAVLDVAGLAVAPGFINMLSWATESLLVDGSSQSDIRQGVTLEVFGEGMSMGPLSASMKELMLSRQGDLQFDIAWTTLGEYLDHLVAQGIAPNVASFVGATTVRIHELGFVDRPPDAAELIRMQTLVEDAMLEGALGVGSSLIYAPAFYAKTDELIALMQAAAKYGGMYISHMRSEGNRLEESIDELIEIAEQTGSAAEIYHLKIAGMDNWSKFDASIASIEAARKRGLAITANMYTYPAGSTGLDAAMPPWVQEGGYDSWVARLQDPGIREQVALEMTTPTDDWENLYLAAGADKMLLVGFRNPQLRQYAGKTLAEVARLRGQTSHETAMDLVIEDGSRVQVVYFLMSEENVAKTVALPWVSFGSDAGSIANTGVFIKRSTHPRTYGNFARVLGKYVRDEKVLPLQQAIYKLTKLPATNMKIRNRGQLQPGYFADIVVFDPAKVQDHATFAEPHRYSTGVVHVFVNGQRVLTHGEPTGRTPGQVVRGPGWRGWQAAEG